MNGKIINFSALALALSACNVSSLLQNNAAAVEDKLTALSVLITDNAPLANYREVWISVRKLEAIDAQGAVFVLFDNPSGRVFNLVSLQGMGSLLNAVNVPPGNYANFRVTLGRDVSIVDAAGVMRTKQLAGSGATVVVDVAGTLSAMAGKVASLILNFDVAKFTDNAQGEWIPSVKQLELDPDALLRTFGDVDGTVVSVNDDGSFNLEPAHEGATIRVDVHGLASLTDDRARTTLNSANAIHVGDKMEVHGNLNLADQTLEAISAAVGGSTTYSESADEVVGKTVRVTGVVESVVNGVVKLDVKDGSFVPPANAVSVIDVSNAVFGRGNAAMLAVAGQEVEIKGTWDGTQITATRVNVEGAAPVNSANATPAVGVVAEVNARVVSLTGTQLTYDVLRAEHFSPVSATGNQVDIAGAWFKQGAANCLLSGATVELKGTVDSATNALIVNVISVEQGCTKLANVKG